MKLLLLKFTAVLLSLILNFSGLNLSPDPDISELPNYGPDIFAETYCVLEGESGAVLLQKDMLKRMYPASTTKILTALLTLENVEDLNQSVTFTKSAVSVDPSSSTLNPKAMEGETMTVRDVLYGMLLKSANECAAMLGEVVGGSEENFAAMMNARAAEIGCRDSHFVNAHGFHSDDHYTTAYDLALILREAMKNPRYRELNATTVYTIPATNMCGERIFPMGHQMIGGTEIEEGCIGGKTGSTPQAGRTLATAVERDGLYTISTLMRSSTECYYADERVLLEYTYGLYNGTLAPVHFVETNDIVTPTDNVRLRYSPSMNGAVAGTFQTGQSLERVGIYGDWSMLKGDNRMLYAATKFLRSDREVPETEAYDPEENTEDIFLMPLPEETEPETTEESSEETEDTSKEEDESSAAPSEKETEQHETPSESEKTTETEPVPESTEDEIPVISLKDKLIVGIPAFILLVLITVGIGILIQRSRKKKRRRRLKKHSSENSEL